MNRIYPFFLLGIAVLAGCAKEENAINLSSAPPAIQTELSFQAGERVFTANAVEDRPDAHCNTLDFTPCTGQEGECVPSSDVLSQWTAYSPAAKSFSITRQDRVSSPGFLINLWVPANIDLGVVPQEISNARLTLRDFQHVFVPLTDDPATSAGPIDLKSADDLQVTLTAIRGDQVEGTFSGVVTTAGGFEVSIENGVFKAQLRRM